MNALPGVSIPSVTILTACKNQVSSLRKAGMPALSLPTSVRSSYFVPVVMAFTISQENQASITYS